MTTNTTSNAAPVVTVENLSTRFGSHVVHDGVNLHVKRGEIIAIVGGSGSGKSVLLKEMIGLLRPAAGQVRVLGHDPFTSNLEEAASLRRRWGVLFQESALFSGMSVAQNILLPLREFTKLTPAQRCAVAALKIALVGLPALAADKTPSELSGGMKKRVGLARALALDPEILFLDEPTAGLDPIAAAAFDELVLNLRDSLGLSVVMVTHDLDTLHAICDRVAVLVDKKIIVGTLDEIKAYDHPWIHSYFHGPRGRAATV